MRASTLLFAVGLTATGVLAKGDEHHASKTHHGSAGLSEPSADGSSDPSSHDKRQGWPLTDPPAHAKRQENPWDSDPFIWFPPSHEKRQTKCDMLDPGCWLSKRDTTVSGLPSDCWTEWACARGAEVFCSWPYLDKGDDIDTSACSWAAEACNNGMDCACYFLDTCAVDEDLVDWDALNDCLCAGGYPCASRHPESNYQDLPVPQSDVIQRRDGASHRRAPVKAGQVTTVTTKVGQTPVTAVISVAQTSPLSVVWKSAVEDTTVTLDMSAKAKDARTVVVKTILSGHSQVSTRTMDQPFEAGIPTPAPLDKRAANVHAEDSTVVFGSTAGEVSTKVSAIFGQPYTLVQSIVETSPFAVVEWAVIGDHTATDVVSAQSTDARVVEIDLVAGGERLPFTTTTLDKPFIPGATITFQLPGAAIAASMVQAAPLAAVEKRGRKPTSRSSKLASDDSSLSMTSDLPTVNFPSSPSGKVNPSSSSMKAASWENPRKPQKRLPTVDWSSSQSRKSKPSSQSGSARTETVSSLDNNPPLVVKKIISGADTRTKTSTVGVWPALPKRMAKRDVGGVATVTILDQQPGHTILNEAAAGSPTTYVTIVNDHGIGRTLRPTTDHEGRTILATEPVPTVTVFPDSDFDTTKRVLGNGHHTLIPTTDNDGNEIFVTETGVLASSTTTMQLVSDMPNPKVAIPARPATVTKVITRTVRKPAYDYDDDCHCEWMTPMSTIAYLGQTKIAITKSLQMLNNSTMIRVMPKAEATLLPLVWEEAHWHGWEHVIPLTIKTTMEMYPDADWDEIPRMAHHLHDNEELDPDMKIKKALVMWIQGTRPRGRYRVDDNDYPDLSSHDPNQVTVTQAVIAGYTHSITAPTQTIPGHGTYVADPLMKYKMYDPLTHAVAPTGSCHGPIKKHKRHGKFSQKGPEDDHHHLYHVHNHKEECKIERCMWDFMKPLQITTAAPMALYDQHGEMVYDYFTHTTHLHRPHWGTSDHHGLYYPVTHTMDFSDNGTVRHHRVHRQFPPEELKEWEKRKAHVHDDPPCYDTKSCHHFCVHHHDGWKFDPKMLLYILPIIAAVALLALCCCGCCWCLHRRRKRHPEKETIPDKIRRMSTKNKPEDVVVNNVTGTATDPATGNPVDPTTAAATAVVAGPAAGAAAANEKGNGDGKGDGNQGGEGGGQPAGSGSGDDGRGTTGRRAEEGRGRVNFADGGGNPGGAGGPSGAPGSGGEGGGAPDAAARPAEHAAEEAPKAAEHAEPVPVHDGAVDGAYTAGRQMVDFGSMRGRKRNRGEGAAPGGLGIF